MKNKFFNFLLIIILMLNTSCMLFTKELEPEEVIHNMKLAIKDLNNLQSNTIENQITFTLLIDYDSNERMFEINTFIDNAIDITDSNNIIFEFDLNLNFIDSTTLENIGQIQIIAKDNQFYIQFQNIDTSAPIFEIDFPNLKILSIIKKHQNQWIKINDEELKEIFHLHNIQNNITTPDISNLDLNQINNIVKLFQDGIVDIFKFKNDNGIVQINNKTAYHYDVDLDIYSYLKFSESLNQIIMQNPEIELSDFIVESMKQQFENMDLHMEIWIDYDTYLPIQFKITENRKITMPNNTTMNLLYKLIIQEKDVNIKQPQDFILLSDTDKEFQNWLNPKQHEEKVMLEVKRTIQDSYIADITKDIIISFAHLDYIPRCVNNKNICYFCKHGDIDCPDGIFADDWEKLNSYYSYDYLDPHTNKPYIYVHDEEKYQILAMYKDIDGNEFALVRGNTAIPLAQSSYGKNCKSKKDIINDGICIPYDDKGEIKAVFYKNIIDNTDINLRKTN